MIIYEDDDLKLVYSGNGGQDCFATFTSWGKSHSNGFGQPFFDQKKVSGLYFISKSDHWWHTPGMPRALEEARLAFSKFGHTRVITYGASMGGYGSALYASPLGASMGILIAPQFEIQPELAPFETRWKKEASRISFTGSKMALEVSQGIPFHIIYDPYTFDRKHADLFASFGNVNRIHVPFGGHTPGQLLAQAGMLKKVVFDLANATFDSKEFFQKLHESRRHSAVYWASINEHAGTRRPQIALYALNKACHLAPKEVVYILRHIYLLLQSDQPDEALAAARKATELAPDHPAPWRALAKCLQAIGAWSDGVDAVQKAIKLRTVDADLYRVLLELLVKSERYVEAIEIAKIAVSMDISYAKTHELLHFVERKLRGQLSSTA